ncbi:STAS domain-containing protein [Pseudonocardia bannensis]|uniref:STAS domain-containing protein n=1 Tax=Pseudonocardia bannensis TaxID=630973 RepID=A0A848DT07_9PSEU|nr:STAS domain-containing protein [Pseudonocardia bannensis]NMH95619.1 STAS domain-containing protein [Pseudonocardia bannensis]
MAADCAQTREPPTGETEPVPVVVAGDVVAHELERRLPDALPGDPAPRVAVDLSGVMSPSPAGLDVLPQVRDRLTARGGRLDLVSPSPAVVLLLHDAAPE